MADMSGRAGDSLAEKAQLGGETQKGHLTAQTRDRECVKRLDLLNPELQVPWRRFQCASKPEFQRVGFEKLDFCWTEQRTCGARWTREMC